VKASDLALPPPAEGSAQVAHRIAAARARQKSRSAALPAERRIRTNAEADGELLDAIASPDPEGKKLLLAATERLSPRPQSGANPGRSRRQRSGAAAAYRRGAELPPGGDRGVGVAREIAGGNPVLSGRA
jgi:hypothetical protein